VTEHVPDPLPDALRLRASDADRERVAGLLRDAYVEGRLSAVEHEDRLSDVYRATTYADLVPLLHDLPVPPGSLAVPEVGHAVAIPSPSSASRVTSGAITVDPSRATHAQGPAVAIFSGHERHGSWVVPASMPIVAVMGGIELDLSQAVLTSRETVFHCVAVMGGIEIRVPDGVLVRMDAFGFMGGTAGPSGDVPPDAPVIRVTGLALMGGIEVTRSKGPKGTVSRELES